MSICERDIQTDTAFPPVTLTLT